MKNTLTIIYWLALCFSLTADPWDKLDDLSDIAETYYMSGRAKDNYIHSVLMKSTQLTHRDWYSSIALNDVENVIDKLKMCVFMKEGLENTVHLDDAMQEILARHFLEDILSVLPANETNVLITDKEGIARTSFRASCIFGLEYENQILLLQGAAAIEDDDDYP